MGMMALGIVAIGIGRRVHAADETCNVARVLEAADRDAVAIPVLHRHEARLEVEAKRVLAGKPFHERGLAGAARAQDAHGGLGDGGGEPHRGGDEAEAHARLPSICTNS